LPATRSPRRRFPAVHPEATGDSRGRPPTVACNVGCRHKFPPKHAPLCIVAPELERVPQSVTCRSSLKMNVMLGSAILGLSYAPIGRIGVLGRFTPCPRGQLPVTSRMCLFNRCASQAAV